ncbi:unnamed protein product, partial [Timema podura]|nr:unnamed protein product [Timema podura]
VTVPSQSLPTPFYLDGHGAVVGRSSVVGRPAATAVPSPPRTRRSSASSVGSTGGGGGGNVNMASLIPAPSQAGGGGRRNRSRSRSPTHAPALRPPSFRSSTHCLVQEPSATPTDTPLNDSSSEVSDEGYRSLGPLVMTPQSSTHILDVNTPLNTNANNLGIPKHERVHWESSNLDCKATDASRKAYYASLLQIEHHSAVLLHPPSECSSNKFPSDEISMTNTVENERPTINSLSTVGSTICINHLDNVSLKQSKSRSSSIDSSESRRLPRTHITVPTQDHSRRTSHSPARSTASTKSQGRPNSGGETTIISSISPKKMAADKNLSPKHNYGESSSASSSLSKATGKQPSGLNNNNTWNGRPGKSKVRPSLTPNTFDNKNNCGLSPRNTFQRKSLGSYGSSHSIPSKISNQRPIKKNSLPASLQTSPTKQISPLLEQILQVNDLNNDENILSKMKEIIQHYSSIVDEKLVEEKKYESAVAEPPNDDGLDFTSAWVHGNGSLEGIQQHHTTRQKESCENKIFDEESSSECSKTGGLKTGPSPRKDSKAEGSIRKTNSSSPNRDSNLGLPILGSLAQQETSGLANYATEAGFHSC